MAMNKPDEIHGVIKQMKQKSMEVERGLTGKRRGSWSRGMDRLKD